MPQYVITQKMNGKDYYLENIYSDNKIVWVTNPTEAISFDNEKELKEFIHREFPNKNYTSTAIHSL